MLAASPTPSSESSETSSGHIGNDKTLGSKLESNRYVLYIVWLQDAGDLGPIFQKTFHITFLKIWEKRLLYQLSKFGHLHISPRSLLHYFLFV